MLRVYIVKDDARVRESARALSRARDATHH